MILYIDDKKYCVIPPVSLVNAQYIVHDMLEPELKKIKNTEAGMLRRGSKVRYTFDEMQELLHTKKLLSAKIKYYYHYLKIYMSSSAYCNSQI